LFSILIAIFSIISAAFSTRYDALLTQALYTQFFIFWNNLVIISYGIIFAFLFLFWLYESFSFLIFFRIFVFRVCCACSLLIISGVWPRIARGAMLNAATIV
jgi:hypothetical protein